MRFDRLAEHQIRKAEAGGQSTNLTAEGKLSRLRFRAAILEETRRRFC